MGSIFGIISKRGNQIDEGLLHNCMIAIGQCAPGPYATWLEGNVAFACQHNRSHQDSNYKASHLNHAAYSIAADCRIDYREELIKELGIVKGDLKSFPDKLLILESYIKWGESCVEHLCGDFAFSIWDKNRQKLFCARDHMGCRPFYYFEDEQYILFSSNMRGFEPVPEVGFSPQEKYILHHFSSKALPRDATLYSGMKRLPPAHSLVYGTESRLVIKRYWDLEINSSYAELSLDKALEQFICILNEAVSQRIRDLPAFGVELSGGLDSSSVAVVAQEVKPKGAKVHSFINALSDDQKKGFFPFFDETAYGRSVSDYAGLDSFQVINGEKGKASLESILDAIEITHTPVMQLFPVFSDQLLDRVREQNLELILSGFGGDECVSYHARGFLNECAARGDWGEVRRSLVGKSPLKRMTIWVKLFLEHRLINHSKFLKKIVPNRKALYRAGDVAMDATFLKSFMDLEKERQDSRNPVEYMIREQQKRRLNHESVSDRLENSCLLARKRNIEYAYPLLDIRLLEFVYSLPSEFKFRNGMGRYMMRQAMEGLLPDNIRLRTSKFGAAIPNIFYRFHLDQDEYFKLIDEAEEQNNFHYLNYNKLRWQIGKLMDQKNFEKLSFGPRIFFSSISLLILQKWKREGKMNTGIKC